MAFNLFDRVRETSTTTGTGDLTLNGTLQGFRTFASVLASGDTTWYAAAFGGEWEVGLGTFTTPNTISRTSVLSSSNGGSLVNFSAGSKDVFMTPPASVLKKLNDLATLGTAAARNTGTTDGTVPLIGAGDKLALSVIPSLMALGLTDGAGKLLASLMPALAITDVFPVASQAAMLALTAQRGDVAIRTDQGIAYILATDSPSTLADWKALPLPAGVVMQVAGLSGPTITGAQLINALGLKALAFVDAVTTALLADDAVTNAKLANVPAGTFKGRLTTGTGDPEDLTTAYTALGDLTGTVALNFAAGFQQTATLIGNITLGQPAGGSDGQPFVLELKQDSTGGRTIAVNTTYIKVPPAITLTLSTAANARDKIYGTVRVASGVSTLDVEGFVKGLPA